MVFFVEKLMLEAQGGEFFVIVIISRMLPRLLFVKISFALNRQMNRYQQEYSDYPDN